MSTKSPKLLMDHFYRVISKSAFDEAKQFVQLFPEAEHRKSDTNYGTWEGIYLMTSSGAYIEFILEDSYWKQSFVSMCTSLYGDEENLHYLIETSNPSHRFSLSEIDRPNGNPWMFCTMLESSVEDIYFYAEEYRSQERSLRKTKGQSENNWLKTVDSLECSCTPSQFEIIPEISTWFTKKITTKEKSIELEIRQLSGSVFVMSLSPTHHSARPFSIHGTYDPNKTVTSPKQSFEHFDLSFSKGSWSLKYKRT